MKYSITTNHTFGKFNFYCRSRETSYSRGHEVEMTDGTETLTIQKIRYYNRTRESFQYESCIKKCINSCIDELESDLIESYKIENGIKRLKTELKNSFLEKIRLENSELRELYNCLKLVRN